ncbi:kinase-like protein [Penicillium angulare]|uniref:kinase-like protein n=1 Tax=Penicillium angulare TaxID=116970 RepID=UPI00253FEF78|nr:kinase-like protein [Penicillium angulare]KAJ5279193.1 kinase-like protein [Penicillium angulare]
MDANFDTLSVSELYQKYGEPPTETIERSDEKPFTPGVPTHATEPIWLGKQACEFKLSEARLILSDFGEAFSPLKNKKPKLGKDCSAPRYCLPPEAYFEPENQYHSLLIFGPLRVPYGTFFPVGSYSQAGLGNQMR